MSQFYAQPYNPDYAGFYFDSSESYEKGMKKLNRISCEEVEIQFINGDNASLYQALESKCDMERWYEEFDHLSDSDDEAIALIFISEYYNDSLNSMLDKIDDVSIFHGSALDYAYDYADDCLDINDSIRPYFDYEALARDLEINNQLTEVGYETYVINGMNL